MALCPSHPDGRTPALSIGEGDDGRVLLHCFGGCTAEEVTAALGLTMRDLMNGSPVLANPGGNGRPVVAPAAQARRRGRDEEREAKEEKARRMLARSRRNLDGDCPGLQADLVPLLRELAGGYLPALPERGWGACWTLPICDPEGREVGLRLRHLDPGASPKARTIGSGGLMGYSQLSRKPEAPVSIASGETDLLAGLRACPEYAWTSPTGEGHDLSPFAPVFAGRDLVLVPDCDEAGRKHELAQSRRLKAALREADPRLTTRYRVVSLPLAGTPGAKDLRDWLSTVPAPARARAFRELVAAASFAVLREGEAGGSLDPSDPEAWEPPLPLGEHAAPPFPVECLPSWLGSFVAAEARGTQTPLDLAGMLGLSVLSAAAAGRVRVEPRRGWREPCNLYVLVALPPAERKSAVFAHVAGPFLDLEAALGEEAQPAIREALARRKAAEAALADAERLAGKARGLEQEDAIREAASLGAALDEIRVPAVPRLVADDATPEALVSLLAEQDGRMAVLSPEGELFEVLAGRYDRRGVANMGCALKAHAGDDIRVDRKGRPPEHVKGPALTLGLAVQPDVIRTMAAQPGFRGRGLLARFLYSLPISPVGTRDWVEGAREPVAADYRAAVVTLTRGCYPLESAVTLTLSPAATDLLRGFDRELEPRLHPETGDLAHIGDWAGKLVGAVVRIAGLLHVGDHLRPDGIGPVPGATMERAIQLGDYLLAHAFRTFGLMAADPVVERARATLVWIRRNGITEFSVQDRRQAMPDTEARTADAVKEVLDLLADRGFLRPLPVPRPGPRGGRPASPRYVVSPLLGSDRKSIESAPNTPETSREGVGPGSSRGSRGGSSEAERPPEASAAPRAAEELTLVGVPDDGNLGDWEEI
jgi:hypothetical protein